MLKGDVILFVSPCAHDYERQPPWLQQYVMKMINPLLSLDLSEKYYSIFGGETGVVVSS
jgi:hypothetical protein